MVKSECVALWFATVLTGQAYGSSSEGFQGVLLQGSRLTKARNSNKLSKKIQQRADTGGAHGDKLVREKQQQAGGIVK